MRVELDGERSRSRHARRRARDRLPEHDPDGDADRVDRDVERRAVTAGDERLVELVADRVERPERERQTGSSGRADEQRAEDGVLGRVRDLAQHEIPAAEPGSEVGHRREREDQRRPRDDGQPEARRETRTPSDDRLARNQEHGEGTRCESGTVPPL